MPADRSLFPALRLALHVAMALTCAATPALAQPRPASPPASGAAPPAPAASAGGLSDAVARCEARPGAAERRACRRALAHQAPSRT